MKLAWFTPVIKISAIAYVSLIIIKYLIKQGHQITVISTEDKYIDTSLAFCFDTECISWLNDERVKHVLEDTDIAIYQIGDSLYHIGSLKWLENYPGIVCLHDFFIAHLFIHWSKDNETRAYQILQAWYGNNIAQQFYQFNDSTAFNHFAREQAPLTEWICAQASAVITHNNIEIDRILKACPGPVQIVPLCFEKPTVTISSTQKPQTSFNIVTFGIMNENKRMSSVIEAIGRSKWLQEHACYHLAGAIDPVIADKLKQQAEKWNVKLNIMGAVDEATLCMTIIKANVVCCLRWPSLEAASASLIEALQYGKATIVTNTSFYQECPDDYVKKIDPHNEIHELTQALEDFYNNPETAAHMGSKAQAWVKQTFSTENYANQLLSLINQTIKSQPLVNMLSYFAELMNDWGASESLLTLPETLNPLAILEQDR